MISIILPVLNEMRHGMLPRVLEGIKKQSGEYELIIVDSASTDRTVEYCQPYADQIIHVGKVNRAVRMNSGSGHAKGDILLFHHPRSFLSEGALLGIQRGLEDPQVVGGGFTHCFDEYHPLLRFTSWYNNTVQPKKGVMYLDHCLFVRHEVFDEIGGFPDWDIFEDTKFPQEMAKRGKIILLPEHITTSATRYRRRGIYKQAFTNQMLKLGYNLGIHPNTLNKLYEGKNPFNVH